MFEDFGYPEDGYPMMPNDFGYNDYGYNGYNGYGDYGYNDFGYGGRQPKVLKATTSNVQMEIAARLGVDVYALKFVKLDELPYGSWKHSCFFSGVTEMQVEQFVFEDGSLISYGICPFFPNCNVVHYFVDRNAL